VYKPPDIDISSFSIFLENHLDSLTVKNKLIFLTGDFNVDLLKYQTEQSTTQFLDQVISSGLLPTITLPTRISHSSATLLDTIFTNNVLLPHYSKIIFDDISDHLPVFYRSNLKKLSYPSHVPQAPMKRIFSSHNYSIFKDLVRNIDWNPILHNNHFYKSSSPNASYDIFYSKIFNAFNAAFPLVRTKQTRTSNKPSLPWLSPTLVIACRKKSRLLKKYQLNRTPQNKGKLNVFRNNLKKAIRKEERQYYAYEFNKRSKNVKLTWEFINELLHRNKCSTHSQHVPTIIHNNIKLTDPTLIANQFNIYFSSVGSTLASKIPSTSVDFTSYLPHPNPFTSALFPTTPTEILNLISDLDNTSTHGDDLLSGSVIKSIGVEIATPLSLIINHSFTESIFPTALKIAKIIPLHKNGSKSELCNYRPISLLNIFSKIYERAIFNRMSNFIDKHHLLYQNQFGFRKHHSTELALIKLVDNITHSLDDKKHVCCVLIDLKKAFDTVDFEILLAKLNNFGFRGHFLQYLKSYLYNRYQYVSMSEFNSTSLPTTYGIPQGSILGPLLFLIYINDLHNAVTDTEPILFADDNTLAYASNTLQSLFSTINRSLVELNSWLVANKLTINTSKTNYILFKNNLSITPHPILFINNIPIKQVTEAPILGVTIDQNLSFKSHIASLRKKLASSLFIFARIRYNLPSVTARLLYNSLFKSHLTYCTSIWGNACPTYLHPIHILHNKFLKNLLLLPKKTNTIVLYKQAAVLTLSNLYKYAILLIIFKFFHNCNNFPSSLSTLFSTVSQQHTHSTRSSSSSKLFIRPSNISIRHNFIIIQGPVLWNSLPSTITSVTTISQFKLKLHQYLLDH
jgi:hypothetical protein